jgi:hypothetical protein
VTGVQTCALPIWIAYDSLNQVVGINANKYNGDKQKIEIEVIAYEE